MQEVISNMINVFDTSKTSGSYFLLYLLSLFVLFIVNKEKNEGYLLYGIGVLLVVVANPVTVWIISRIFPVMTTYTPFILLIPVLLYIPYACVELFERLKDNRKKRILMVLLLFTITVSGNIFGFYKNGLIKQNYAPFTKEEKEIIQSLDNEDVLVLADESIAPFMRSFTDHIKLLYGKDLWTPGLDIGIMDEYSEEMLDLYEAMKNPQECMDDIVKTAAIYECDIIVIKNYKSHKAFSGSYQLKQETEHYLVYGLR